MENNTITQNIGPNTRYIISTSGRITSLKRYQKLLQTILQLDVAYIPIHNNNNPIDPLKFTYTLKGMPCIGGAISKDIKYSIIPYLDHIDPLAASIQSVNTVIIEDDGTLTGYNTDAIGFKHAIINGIQNSNVIVNSVVCYGYGGVINVVVAILRQLNINNIYLAGRNMNKIITRAKELNIMIWNNNIQTDLFINATPITDQPLDDLLFINILNNNKIVFDHEMPGKYLKEYCDINNIYHISGYDMYYPQMIEQWKLFLKSSNKDIDINNLFNLIKQAEEP